MEAYIPDILPEEDIEYFEEGGFGGRNEWGDTVGLLVVDMTREFTQADSDLGREDTAAEAITAIGRLLEVYRTLDRPAFYTTPEQSFPEDYPGTTKATPDRESRRKGGNEIPDRIAPHDDDVLVRKPRASAFFDHLANMLREIGIDTLLVTGMTTSGCVRASVVDAHSSNFTTVVPKECVADRGIASHEISLFDMDMKYADVESVDRVIEKLSQQ